MSGQWYEDDPGEDGESLTLATWRNSCLYADESLATIPQPQPLIDRWLALDSLAWLFGERGACKSFVALDMAACIRNGLDWHGYTTKQVPVLYAALEGAAGLHVRARAWSRFHEQATTGIQFLVPRPQLQIVHHAAHLGELAADMDAGLVIVDTQNRATVGLDENSNVDMGKMIAALDQIREMTRACILVIHHAAVGTHRPRGHSSIDGAATAMIRVAKDGGLVKVENSKQREDERTRSVLLTLANHDLGVVLAASSANETPTDSGRLICGALRDLTGSKDKVSWSDLKRACVSLGMNESTFNYALRQLVEQGRIVKFGSYYALGNPAQGRLE